MLEHNASKSNGKLHKVESMPISNFHKQSQRFSLNKPYHSCLALFRHQNECDFLLFRSNNSSNHVLESNFLSIDQASIPFRKSSIEQHFQ